MANKVFLVGRLVRDPEIKYTQTTNGDMAIGRFTVACDRKFKRDGEPTADFINCVAFGKTAEFLERYCVKGTKLVVEGRIQTGSYTNKDGNKVYTTDIAVENLEFAESKASASNTAEATPDNYAPTPVDEEDELPFDI